MSKHIIANVERRVFGFSYECDVLDNNPGDNHQRDTRTEMPFLFSHIVG